MLTAGYEFYRGTYHGDKITAAEWPVLSRDAAACLEELTLGRGRRLTWPRSCWSGARWRYAP